MGGEVGGLVSLLEMSELVCDWRVFLIRSPTRIHLLSEKQSPPAGKVFGRLVNGLSNS